MKHDSRDAPSQSDTQDVIARLRLCKSALADEAADLLSATAATTFDAYWRDASDGLGSDSESIGQMVKAWAQDAFKHGMLAAESVENKSNAAPVEDGATVCKKCAKRFAPQGDGRRMKGDKQ